jgi:hypothetical protein
VARQQRAAGAHEEVRVSANDAAVTKLVDHSRSQRQEPRDDAAQAAELSCGTAHIELIGVRSGCL